MLIIFLQFLFSVYSLMLLFATLFFLILVSLWNFFFVYQYIRSIQITYFVFLLLFTVTFESFVFCMKKKLSLKFKFIQKSNRISAGIYSLHVVHILIGQVLTISIFLCFSPVPQN